MSAWLLAVSRDAHLAQAIASARFRARATHQLWAIENPGRARHCLTSTARKPSVIVLDELFLRGEPLLPVAGEFAGFAPVIFIARPSAQIRLAPLVAQGKVDFVPRDDHYIPLTAALVERAIRWEQEAEEESARQAPARQSPPIAESVSGASSDETASRMVGRLLDHLESVFNERCRLTPSAAHRLDRIADLAFELKQFLQA